MVRDITKADVEAALDEAYRACQKDSGGKDANYIPYLANINPDLFALCVCFPDGTTLTRGDADYRFGIESISKVSTALLVLQQSGADRLLQSIGADATGLPFNSIMAMLLERDHPTTPLVNAGAIAACSLVEPLGDRQAKWDAIAKMAGELCGAPLSVIEKLYTAESQTNYNNRSIAWLLKSYNRIYDDPELSLELYTRQCSLGVTCTQLATMGATIAADGVNPLTRRRVFAAELTPKILALITSVGFYEHTGDWLYTAGIPAKTGVGGGIMAVMPGLFGLAAFSPRVDSSGNSVRAQDAIKRVMNALGITVFDSVRLTER